MNEESLGGNVTAAVRVGNTVRRPVGPWTDAVDALLEHLAAVGFTGAPKALGRDEQGRQVLEFVPGGVGTPSPDYSLSELHQIGHLLRDLHTATASFTAPAMAEWNQVIVPDRQELICHNDPAPWNLVKAADRWVFIDWDFAGPGSRLWDLAYNAQTSVPLQAGLEVSAVAPRLRALVDGYDLDGTGRIALAGMLARRARAMHEMLQRRASAGEAPWSRIWIEDGPYWDETADYLATNSAAWADALL
ncbi:MAG TPA: phosphotransferase [Acidothermaceae bacterium]